MAPVRAVRVGGTTKAKLPAIGLGMASHGEALGERELQLLGALGPRHLRQDVHLDAPGWGADLSRTQVAASQLGCALELAVLSEAPPDPGCDLASRLGEGPLVAHVLALAEGAGVTSADWLDAVRGAAGDPGRDALFAAGSNANFTELNRAWEGVQGVPAVAYALNPQVHAFDDRSLTESLPVQGLTVRTARARAPGCGVVVSPITLRPRFNPTAADGNPPAPPGELPAQVDGRQPSLLAAGWTLGSLASLATAGATSCTYFETTGWRGVLERDAGCPLPERFPSRPGMTFPVYHVLADALEAGAADVLGTEVPGNEPPAVAALALRSGGRLLVLLANLGPEPQHVTVTGLADGPVRGRAVDEHTAAAALLDPLAFRAWSEPLEARSGELHVELQPYAYLRADQQLPGR